MGAQGLGSRAIIGEFYAALEQNIGAGWIPGVSNLFESNQESETYKFLGLSPAMREFIGGRHAKGFRENGITIENKKYEATLEVLLDEIRRDKTDQVMMRVRELAQRTNAHWAKLLSTLLIGGEAATCYDGQYFFDTDHAEGDSGTQSNDIGASATSATAPTAGEMEAAIMGSIEQILSFKDDQGEPMNEDAMEFNVMVPVSFMGPAASAIGSEIISSSSNSIITLGQLGGFKIGLTVNPRLTWTTKLATFRTDCESKALIRQEEEGVTVAAIAEGSELEFNEEKHHYGVKAIRNVGYGLWQRSCLTTFS